MTDLQTMRLSVYAVCSAATLEKKFHYTSIHLLIETVTGNGAQMSEGGQLPHIGITTRPMATIGGIELSGMKPGTKNK